jgi:hydrogenase expression/formation protein HypC
VRRQVNVQLLTEDGLAADDWVLIHVGFAMSKISASQAEEQMRLLRMLGEGEEAMAELEGYELH